MMNTSITIKKFKIDDLPLSNSWLILGRIGSGKTTMMKNLLYFNKHKYCTAKIQTNDPEGYVDWCKIVDTIFVNLGYTTEGTKRYIDKFSINHNCIIINNKNHSTNIMDKIFYYEPIEINKKWRFGCDECKLWNDKRLKKDYKN